MPTRFAAPSSHDAPASSKPFENVRIVFPFATPSQNVLQKWHWSKRHAAHHEARLLIRAQLRERGIFCTEMVTERRKLEVVRWGPRILDFGNLVGGFKPYLDALVSEGLFRDDSPRWIEESYHQGKPRRGVSQTIIVVSVSYTPMVVQ